VASPEIFGYTLVNAYKDLAGHLKIRDQFGDPGAAGVIIIQRLLKVQRMRMWTVFIRLRTGSIQ
jgi:hypothetical protein